MSKQLTVFDLLAPLPAPVATEPEPQPTGDTFCVGMWIAWSPLSEHQITEIFQGRYGLYAKVTGVSWDVCLDNHHYPVWPAYGPYPPIRRVKIGWEYRVHDKDRAQYRASLEADGRADARSGRRSRVEEFASCFDQIAYEKGYKAGKVGAA